MLKILVVHNLYSHAMGRPGVRVRFMINVNVRVRVESGIVVGS